MQAATITEQQLPLAPVTRDDFADEPTAIDFEPGRAATGATAPAACAPPTYEVGERQFP